MRRWTAALAAVMSLAVAGGGSAASPGKTSIFTGYAFDACSAPKTATLQSWLASPYRALGIYIGGTNRACANTQLSADWVATTESLGWSLIPLYVGLQAPCNSKAGLAKFTAASAPAQGTAAADDAVAGAGALGIPRGSPIYFDLEAYAENDDACTQTVQAFISSWVTELHAQGYVAGVYGSAGSTIRDLQALAATASPDDVWIADWNGRESVFGDPYVSDALWTAHQRLHQYQGAHDETWGGVTINVDSSYMDAAVAGPGSVVTPQTPQPVAVPGLPPAPSAAGSVSSDDGQATVSWTAGAFRQSVVVQLNSAPPGQSVPGFGDGGYGVQLQVQQTAAALVMTSFRSPLEIHIAPQRGPLVPVRSADGVTWQPVPVLVDGKSPIGSVAGYVRNGDGSYDVRTLASGYFALLPDKTPPPAPAGLTGRFAKGSLVLQWPQSIDAGGPAAGYQVTLTNRPLLSVSGRTTAAIANFHSRTPSVFRVVATDAAGNVSRPSKPVVVLPSKRPAGLPKILPAWAWKLYTWQQTGKLGHRPRAPRIVPDWYWRWEAWRAFPFHIRG